MTAAGRRRGGGVEDLAGMGGDLEFATATADPTKQAMGAGQRRLAQEEAAERRDALQSMTAMVDRAKELEAAEQHNLDVLKQQRSERLAMIGAGAGMADQALELFNATEGQMELVRGLSQVAMSVGSYPDPVGIAQHALSAALHFKNAASLGVSGGGESAGASAGGGAARPLPPRDFGGGGGEQTVVVNFNAPTDEAQLGRMLARSQRVARRRFG